MSKDQLIALERELRGFPAPSGTLAERRAGFEMFSTRPPDPGVTVTEVTLGGVPALLVEPSTTTVGTVLHLHGGGYALGSARSGVALASALAHRAGASAHSLGYRLAPEHPFPAAVEDGLAAYRGLLDAGYAPDRVALTGESSGGGLALAVLLAARDADLPQPAAVVLMSPWVDLTLSGESLRTHEAVDPMNSAAGLAENAARYLDGADPADPAASPLLADLHGLPPLLVQVGAHDVLLDDATRLAARAAAADVDVTLEAVAGAPHVFQNFEGRIDEADRALHRAGRFLAEHLAR
ncbi:alpha/beta hydrolase [Cellulomonas sp. zg-ZUI22]|uniref:alpha/beta hydrolase n=1 Tax=Cellulomonas sp. zg-ZUI22 TaxID=2816955 RepID=UPI001F5F390F|nr:alpha/beta hydrolase [Cellulomonas sp. zg-ZUI22]